MSLTLPLKNLLSVCNPLENPWTKEPIDIKEVMSAIDEMRFNRKSFAAEDDPYRSRWTRQDHIERIAFLATQGWTDPIQIDVGVPSLGVRPGWIIDDGNHRVVAAIARGETHIWCEVSGEVEYAKELLQTPWLNDSEASQEARGRPKP